MKLDFINDLVNNLKDSNVVENFMNELSEYLEKNSGNQIDLMSDNLHINGSRVISKYRDIILTERNNILQEYAKNTSNLGDMYYIYDKGSNQNIYNLCSCEEGRSHEVITKNINELPNGADVGCVLRENNGEFSVDVDGTKNVNNQINEMINDKLQEQSQYLKSKRIDGHVYEVGEKYEGIVELYDLADSDNGMEAVEEIEFSDSLYNSVNEGDRLVYKNGEYIKED